MEPSVPAALVGHRYGMALVVNGLVTLTPS